MVEPDADVIIDPVEIELPQDGDGRVTVSQTLHHLAAGPLHRRGLRIESFLGYTLTHFPGPYC